MPLAFDEDYFNASETGYKEYRNFPHFRQRAEWVRENLSGEILEVGCAYGYMMFELNQLGMIITGVDKSIYATNRVDDLIANKVVTADVKDIIVSGQYDWMISWNTLDCLDDEDHAVAVAAVLNTAKNQLHVLCMSEVQGRYTKLNYFIRDVSFWRNLLPNAILVCVECKKVYNPTALEISKVPLHTAKGVSD